MTKKILTVCVALACCVSLMAQKISVVSSSGSTKIYKTLVEAIEGASSGSVIYLPGGGFPIGDSVKIKKKLTIIGIGHKIKTENPDGYTTVSGNLFFNQGSDGSAVMGCYVTGTINIGADGKEVDDMLIRCCNVNSVNVRNNKCLGTFVNQNYIRSASYFNQSSADFSNNIAYAVHELDNGFITNNVLLATNSSNTTSIVDCNSCSITNNVFYKHYSCSQCFFENNLMVETIDSNTTIADWNKVFVKNGGINSNSDFHFQDTYKQYDGKVGIYGGTGFSDNQLAPVPYIVAKVIPEQTDAAGKLNIKIRVKAGE